MRSRLEKQSFNLRATRVDLRPLLVAFSLALLMLLAPQGAQAASPLQQDGGATPEVPMTLEEKQGCGCHSMEKESWQISPHGALDANGQPAATCATCHGEYVEGHPDEGMIPLATDSSACTDCHEQTAQQWEGTIHAEAGIQCISCHLSHSQDLRVTSDHLCQSCHRDSLKDPLHSAHWLAETSCTSCHMADAGVPHGDQSVASSDPLAMLQGTTSHDFVTVSAAKCLDCHSKDVTSLDGPVQTQFVVRNELMQAANQVPALRTELENAQAANRTLSLWQPVSLGTGIGIGGILGIAFVLIAVRLGRSKQDDDLGGQS